MNEITTTEVTEDIIAESINQQYEEINTRMADVVRRTIQFGATLAQAEIELEKRGRVNRKNGDGMKSWLAKNCPQVKYQTAMRWKQLAITASSSLGCSSSQALAILRGDDVEATDNQKKRRDMFYDLANLRKISQLVFDFASEDKGRAGRPVGSVASDDERLTAVESARRLWAQPISLISRSRGAFYSSVTLLPLDEARIAFDELTQLLNALKKRIKEES